MAQNLLLKPTTKRTRSPWRGHSLAALLTPLLLPAFTTPAWAQAPSAAPSEIAEAAALERAFAAIVREVAPSVVGIRAQRTFSTEAPAGRGPDSLSQTVLVHGSGAILSADGEILTNQHVVQNTTRIDVLLSDGNTAPATIAASDARADLAILKINRTGLKPVRFCNWSEVRRGQWSIVVGNPFGLGGDGQLSVSTGVIANLDRALPGLGEVDDRLYHDMLQTTAAINPGNSGGPLFNLRGELIGVVTAMHTRAVLDDGVGFAIPMSPTRREQIQRLRAGRTPEYGYLGLSVRSLEPIERSATLPPNDFGVAVDRVEPDGPAARAGVVAGDRLLRLNGVPLSSAAQLAELAGKAAIGAPVSLDLLRSEQPLSLSVPVEPRTAARVSWLRSGGTTWRGLRLSDLTPPVRERLRVPADARGIVVMDVLEDSPAARADLHVGDVIDQVGGAAISSVADFLSHLPNASSAAELSVLNRGRFSIAP